MHIALIIGNYDKIEIGSNDQVDQTYNTKYAPEETVLEHLVFSLKYDDIDLGFLKAVFEKTPNDDIVSYIFNSPSGKYAQKIDFLYEFLIDQELNIDATISGNYTKLLNESKYFTGKAIKNPKWKIHNNLLGTPDFCPLVRGTVALNEIIEWNVTNAFE